MKIYLVAYRVPKDAPSETSAEITGAIKALTGYWSNPMPQVWLVGTSDLSAKEISERLQGVLGLAEGTKSKAHILVTRFDQEHQGWLPKATWEWVTEVSSS